jgi:lysophospholipase L1-like esterase
MHSNSNCSNNKYNNNASAVTSFAAAPNSEEVKQACEKAGIPTNAGFSVMGDSISTLGGYIPQGWRCHYEGEVSIPGVSRMQETWWGQVIEHFGGNLVGNASFSGSTVEGFGFPAGCSSKRAAALVGGSAGSGVSTTNDIGENTGEIACEISGEKPQVVLVFIGINDYGWGGAKNQVMGGSASRTAEPEELGGQTPVALTVTTEALQRFKQAYATMLENIRAVAPGAQIWCLTLLPAVMEASGSADEAKPVPFIYSVRGIDIDEYNNAIRACVAQAGECAHVADIRNFNIDYESVDNTHPTALGMKQIATMVCACMEGAHAENAKATSKQVQDKQTAGALAQTTKAAGELSQTIQTAGALAQTTKAEAAIAQLSSYPELARAPKSQRHCEKHTCEGCPYSPLTSSSWCLACGKQ